MAVNPCTRSRRFAAWLLLVACTFASTASAKDFTGPEGPFEPGFWFNADDSGWGLDLHLAGDRMVAGWATYDPEGNPVWYLGIGRQDGDTWRLELKHHQWNVAADAHARGRVAGELLVRFTGREAGTIDWTVDGRSGSSDIQSLLVDRTLTAEDYSGLWLAPELPGAGLSVHSQGPLQLLIAYFYDRNGEPRWAFGTNEGDPARSTVSMKSYRRACPGCDPSIAEDQAVVGEIQFVFRTEKTGSYTVDIAPEPNSIIDASWQRAEAELALLTDLPSARAHDVALAPFTSEATLEAFLRQGLRTRSGFRYYGNVDYSPAPPSPPAPDRSTTNLQVEGVDEADVIKSDGRHLYSLWPRPDEEKRHVLRVGSMENGNYQEVARVRFGDATLGALSGLYLLEDEGPGRPPLLVAVSGGAINVWLEQAFCVGPWFYTDGRVQVHLFDVSDPASPALLHELEFDGAIAQSRRVGDRLLLVTRFASSAAALQDVFDRGERAALIDAMTLADLAPTLRVDDGDPEVLLDPNKTLLPPIPPGDRPAQMTSIIDLDLRRPLAKPDVLAIVGESQAVHVSTDSLWVATNRQAYDIDFASSSVYYHGPMSTDVHRVRIAESGLEYAGSGSVSGHLGWGLTDALRNFRLQQSEDTLRIVTSSGDGWSIEKQHRLSVLDADVATPSDPFVLVSTIPNETRPDPLGKPGENLHGVRYVDNRAYIVTFKKTDPLYVVDLSDASDPQIRGELEVTGFSDYLHPLPNNLLLGFGKGAVPADDIGDDRFVWFQGLQLSLFDVSDAASPRLLERVDLGRRGSESSLLRHHGAFALLAGREGRPTRVAIPAVIHDGEPVDSPTHWYPWQRTGTAMFDVDTQAKTLVLRGVLSAFEADANGERDVWADSQALAARTLLVGDDVYFYLSGEFWTGFWGQDDLGDGPQ